MNRPDDCGGNLRELSCTQQSKEQLPLPHMMMPLPTATPWTLDSMPWSVATRKMDLSGRVMQFNAQNSQLLNKHSQLHHKRRSDILSPYPTKQFISEEKIAAELYGLHISKDYTQYSNDAVNTTNGGGDAIGINYANTIQNMPYQVTINELEEKLKNINHITICEEARKLTGESNKFPILPQALLNRTENPCTALVVWKPSPILNPLQNTSEKTEMENDKNAATNVQGSNLYNVDHEIDDCIDNNNTCNMDFNNPNLDVMDINM